MKNISILLTRYTDRLSQWIYFITGRGYTHISLSLEEENGNFYSFNYQGFCVETVEKHRNRGVNKSTRYELQVADEVYEEMMQSIRAFQENKAEYHYTKLGVFCAILNIPFCRKKHYICSHFVAEMLKNSGAVPLKKRTSTYLPNEFHKELIQCVGFRKISHNII